VEDRLRRAERERLIDWITGWGWPGSLQPHFSGSLDLVGFILDCVYHAG
jgi:ABC-type nitrate/sulfonate/bicarbonate transport system substrate-binding protein